MSSDVEDRLGELMHRIRGAAAAKSVYSDTTGLEKLRHLVQGMTREVPASIRRLLQEITPAVWQASFKNESVRLLEFSELEWIAPSELEKYGFVDRSGGADYFAFACGIYGDVVCVRCTGGMEREVVLVDHEGGGFVYLSHNLCEWIERLMEFDGVEYGYMTGSIEKIESGRQRALLEFHRQLNPEAEWAARGLIRLDFPDGHSQGYLHWNGHELIPIAEAGEVVKITIRGDFQKDLESIADAGLCRDLTIMKPMLQSFDALSRLESLEKLTLFDVDSFECAVLKSHPNLSSIYAVRCGLTNLEELSSARSLKRLRADQCRFNETEWDAISAQRPDLLKSR